MAIHIHMHSKDAAPLEVETLARKASELAGEFRKVETGRAFEQAAAELKKAASSLR